MIIFSGEGRARPQRGDASLTRIIASFVELNGIVGERRVVFVEKKDEAGVAH